ncbi:MAG: hypothetical protein ACK52J_03330 [bacterium]
MAAALVFNLISSITGRKSIHVQFLFLVLVSWYKAVLNGRM